MTRNEITLVVLVCAPLLGSAIVPFVGRVSEWLRNALAFVLVGLALFCAIRLLPIVSAGEVFTVNFSTLVAFQADRLAVFMSLVSLLVGLIIVFYSFGYIAHYEFRNEYYFLVVLFLGSMMGLIYSRNLLLLYVFWEITAFACWRLIGFYRDKLCVWRADKAFLVTVFGALMMLLGFILVYDQTGSFDLKAIKTATATQPLSNIAVLLILFGILSKSATLPLHTWLPDAGVAPSPVTALLHAAVLVKIGVYVYARLFVSTINIDEVWHVVVPWIAGISALVSAGAAMIETDIKRIIAYSTVSQLGFIFLGLSIGNEIGLGGALLYILMHGLAKGGLFLCAGIVEHNTHEKDITRLGGLFETMPITAICFAFCAFSVMGIPPFGGFFSKFMVLNGAVQSNHMGITLIFLLGAFMTIIYLLRVFWMVFLGASRGEAQLPREGSPVMVMSVALLAALSLVSGILIQYPNHFVQLAVNQMLRIS